MERPAPDRDGEPPEARRGYFVTEYLAILLTWKRLAIALLVLIGAATIITAFVLPPKFGSEARLMPVGESDLLGSSRFQTLSQFAGFVDFGSIAGGGTAQSALLSILDSDLLRSRVARELRLADRFGVDYPDTAVRHTLAGRWLRKAVTVAVNKFDNIVITAEASDPDLVIDVLQSTIRQVGSTQNEMNLTTARQTREFIERRMAEAEVTLTDVQVSLTAFQHKHGLIAVAEQQAALVELAAQLETQITLKSAELSATRKFYGEQSSQVRQLEAYIEALQTESYKILRPETLEEADGAARETGAGGDNTSPDARVGSALLSRTGPSMREMPDLAAEYARLAMDVEIQQSLLALLAQQYEQAKISEVREVSSFEVVDPPRVPPKATRTKKKVAFAGLVIGVLAALTVPLLLDSLERHFPAHARGEAQDLLRRLLVGGSK